MKKYLIMFFLTLPYGIFAINLADLEVDPRTKQQIADGFALKQSIDQYIEQNQSSTPVVTVGGDNACDYRIGTTKIQDAINAHTNVEIRIARNDVYSENLVINDNSVSLKGGYANCIDAANDVHAFAYSRTSIRGVTGAEKPTIKILGNTQRNTITLDRLSIENGEGATENFPGGGVSMYQADVQISFTNTIIVFNRSLKGGGIAIIEGNTDILANSLVVFGNTAEIGGGIYCDDSDALLTMHLSSVAANTANRQTVYGGGGGVSLNNGCSFILYSGGGGEGVGIIGNLSGHHGGGLSVSNGSIATLFGHEVCSLSGVCFGSNTKPIRLEGNGANLREGGAVYANGSNTVLNIFAARVLDNKTTNGGGGAIAVSGGATFTTGRLSKACWSQKNCNYYANNTAETPFGSFGHGGAISCNSSTMSITNTVFAYNRADFGTVMYAGSCDTTVRASLMYQNGDYGNDVDWNDDNVIYYSSGTLSIHHSTIADNKSNLAVLHSQNGEAEIVASIIHDASTGPVLSGNSAATVNIECSMLHEDVSVTSQAFTVVDDPKFIDRANRNYRLDPETSPAVDYCYANTGSYRDIDFQERGWDDPAVNNVHGSYDIGSDETYAVIFANGFE